MASNLDIIDGSLFSDPLFFQTQFDENNIYAKKMENLSFSHYFPCLEVKTEFENVTKFNTSSFEPCFDPIIESVNFHTRNCENGDSNIGRTRRVCSTGDLQDMKIKETPHRLSSSPSGSYIEEAITKVGRYSAEERKERIIRYKAKRTLRNFNKTIKYACRKTLADNRPRIRGRFARHDEPEESAKAATSSSYDEEYNLWINAFNIEEEMEEGSLFNILEPHKFKYCSY